MEKGGIIKHDISKSPKTGDWMYSRPEINKDTCIGCETCVQYCPDACIEMIERKTQNAKRIAQDKTKTGSTLRVPSYASIDYDFCKGCGVCAQVCPVKAISMRK